MKTRIPRQQCQIANLLFEIWSDVSRCGKIATKPPARQKMVIFWLAKMANNLALSYNMGAISTILNHIVKLSFTIKVEIAKVNIIHHRQGWH